MQYGIPGKDDQPDPTQLASEALEPTTEFVTEDPAKFGWKSELTTDNTLSEGEEPGRLIRGMRLIRTIFKLATINANILSLPGSVNDAEYTSASLGLTFPTETLLFVPPRISRTITTDGASAWNVRLGWEYKAEGWNKYWRIKTQAYDSMVVKETGADYKAYTPKNQQPWLP